MTASILSGKNLDAIDWDTFVAQSPQGNIYHCHAYLSNLLPDWEAVVLREGAQIVAAFPFETKQKWGIRYALQPFFVQYLGILFAQKSEQVYKNLEFQKKAVQIIHETLPKNLRFLSFNFAPEFDYDLPLIWLGWQQKTCYTCWVDISGGYESFLQACASHVRREIKKGGETGLVVRVENNPEIVVEIIKTAQAEAAKGVSPYYFEALCKNSRHFFETQQSCCLIAYDGENPVAGIIYFFFKDRMIHFQGATLPSHKNSGAMSKIIAESVRIYGADYNTLDLEGSMIEPIERFFRGFGAYPVRYANFTLNRLPFWASWAYSLRKRLKGY